VSLVEENGEYSLFGKGELHLDSMLEELRGSFAGIEVRITDPAPTFRESLSNSSAVRAQASSLNGSNKLFSIASPMSIDLQRACDAGVITESCMISEGSMRTRTALREDFGWDALAAVSVVGCGIDAYSANMCLDDTLPGSEDSIFLKQAYPALLSGFRWGC